jgi:hypothetical protein
MTNCDHITPNHGYYLIIRIPYGGPNKTLAKPEIFFEVSIIPAPFAKREQIHGHS